MYQIERAIPVPKIDRAVYPFGQMGIGDSFLLTVSDDVPAEKFQDELTDLANKARNAAYQFAKKQNKALPDGEQPYHFMLRAVEIETGLSNPETGEPVKTRAYRCWRVEQPPARPRKSKNENAAASEPEQIAA